MKNKTKNRLTSFLLTSSVLLGMLPATATPVFADSKSYEVTVRWDDTENRDGIRPTYIDYSVSSANGTITEEEGWTKDVEIGTYESFDAKAPLGYETEVKVAEDSILVSNTQIANTDVQINVFWSDEAPSEAYTVTFEDSDGNSYTETLNGEDKTKIVKSVPFLTNQGEFNKIFAADASAVDGYSLRVSSSSTVKQRTITIVGTKDGNSYFNNGYQTVEHNGNSYTLYKQSDNEKLAVVYNPTEDGINKTIKEFEAEGKTITAIATGSKYIPASSTYDYVHYLQTDPQWANYNPANAAYKGSMKGNGCVPTSASIMLSHFGHTVLPTEMADKLATAQHYNTSTFHGGDSAGLTDVADWYGLEEYAVTGAAEIATALRAGDVVLGFIKSDIVGPNGSPSGGYNHCVVLMSIDAGGSVTIVDPFFEDTYKVNVNRLWAYRSEDGIDNLGDGPFVAFRGVSDLKESGNAAGRVQGFDADGSLSVFTDSAYYVDVIVDEYNNITTGEIGMDAYSDAEFGLSALAVIRKDGVKAEEYSLAYGYSKNSDGIANAVTTGALVKCDDGKMAFVVGDSVTASDWNAMANSFGVTDIALFSTGRTAQLGYLNNGKMEYPVYTGARVPTVMIFYEDESVETKSVNITFVDDTDPSNTALEQYTMHFEIADGETVDTGIQDVITVLENIGYETTQELPNTLNSNSESVVIHMTHATLGKGSQIGHKPLCRTINFVDEDNLALIDSTEQTLYYSISCIETIDKVTGEVIKTDITYAWENGDSKWAEVSTPEIAGYETETKTVAEQDWAGSEENAEDAVVYVVYKKQPIESTKTLKITFTDENAKPLDLSSYAITKTAKYGETLNTGINEVLATLEENGFERTDEEDIPATFTNNEENDSEISYEVKVDHVIETKTAEKFEKEAILTVKYVYEDGTEANPDSVKRVAYTGTSEAYTLDKATGVKNVTTPAAFDEVTESFEDVSSPVIDGFTADIETVEGFVPDVENEPEVVKTVTYKQTSNAITLTVRDEASGDIVFSKTYDGAVELVLCDSEGEVVDTIEVVRNQEFFVEYEDLLDYTFVKWDVKENGNTVTITPTYKADVGVTPAPSFTIVIRDTADNSIVYSGSFDSAVTYNLCLSDGTIQKTREIETDQNLTVSYNAPDGYRFERWIAETMKDANGKTILNVQPVYVKDTTPSVTPDPETFTLTIMDSDSGTKILEKMYKTSVDFMATSVENGDVSKTIASDTSLSFRAKQKDGYKITGWNVEDDGKTVKISPIYEEIKTEETKAIHLIASDPDYKNGMPIAEVEYEGKIHYVMYSFDDKVIDSGDATTDAAITLNHGTPSGYLFDGWDIKKSEANGVMTVTFKPKYKASTRPEENMDFTIELVNENNRRVYYGSFKTTVVYTLFDVDGNISASYNISNGMTIGLSHADYAGREFVRYDIRSTDNTLTVKPVYKDKVVTMTSESSSANSTDGSSTGGTVTAKPNATAKPSSTAKPTATAEAGDLTLGNSSGNKIESDKNEVETSDNPVYEGKPAEENEKKDSGINWKGILFGVLGIAVLGGAGYGVYHIIKSLNDDEDEFYDDEDDTSDDKPKVKE